MNNRKIIGGLVSLLIIAGALYGFSLYIAGKSSTSNTASTESGQVMCAMDMFTCPNGTLVSRTGANCEFICPDGASSTQQGSGASTNGIETTGNTSTITVTTKLNQKVVFLQDGITVVSLLEDSRCPTDVQCVQAGTVRLNTKITGQGGISTTTVLVLDKPITFNGKTITLVKATPEKNSTVTIPVTSYTFTFIITQ